MDETMRAALGAMSASMKEASEGLYHFTCSEVDSILRVMVLAGHEDDAVTALMGHALCGDGDEEGDRHVAVTRASDNETTLDGDSYPRDLAREYVRELAA